MVPVVGLEPVMIIDKMTAVQLLFIIWLQFWLQFLGLTAFQSNCLNRLQPVFAFLTWYADILILA